jgi:thiol-disulfide isomerase/thioredoxin
VKLLRALLPVLLIAACSTQRGADVLDVELRRLDGGATTLDTVADGPTVVNFWASYCKPCVREMPELEKVASRHPDVRFVGVNAMDEPDRVTEMVGQTGVSYDIWLDENGDAMVAAGVRSLPGTLILKDGDVVYTKIGEITAGELEDALREAGVAAP